MNQTILTTKDKDMLFTLICYGRATPANVARIFQLDRRTAQRLMSAENLPRIVPNPARGDIRRWYELLDRHAHAWYTADGAWHGEHNTAWKVRARMIALVREMLGENLMYQLVAKCPAIWSTGSTGRRYRHLPKRELRVSLDRDFTIPEKIMNVYRRMEPPVFADANGVSI